MQGWPFARPVAPAGPGVADGLEAATTRDSGTGRANPPLGSRSRFKGPRPGLRGCRAPSLGEPMPPVPRARPAGGATPFDVAVLP